MAGLVSFVLVVTPTNAQETGSAGAPPEATGRSGPVNIEVGDLLARCDRFPAAKRAGTRAHLFREAQSVADSVVIVDSPEAAADAMGSWRGLYRFPVLIDDGSLLATENIARFVRAFGPSRVVRWTPLDAPAWPEDIGDRAVRMIRSIGHVVKDEDPPESTRQLIAAIREKRIGPQGVVALDPDDPAWVAGLALAAGRVQPVIFLKAAGRLNGVMAGSDMRGLAQSLQTQMDQVGLEWGGLGDEVDVLTVVGNFPLRVGLGLDGKDEKALTDLLGRHRAGIGNRWAWAGAVIGDGPTSLYRAMCSLFLAADSAWLFDGYGRGDPWDLYDATSAGRLLDEVGFEAEVHDTPHNRVDDWRRVCSTGVDTGLIFVNSKGNMNFFDLSGKRAWCGDIPLLERPAAMHIVHSWSARVPGSPRSVAGRWLEHGVYAFYGSVDEPFLNAFVETPTVAARLMAGIPFGIAVRRVNSPPWKLNVLGDPLTTFLPVSEGGRRVGPDVPLSPLDDIGSGVSWSIKNEAYAAAIRALVLVGRDDDAARLAAALVTQKPGAFGNEAALWSVMPLYRSGRYEAMAGAYAVLSPEAQSTLLLQDALWHAGRVVLGRGPDARLEGLLRRNLRVGQEEHDAVEVAGHIARRAGPAEAVSFLEGVSPTLPNERRREAVTTAIRSFGGPSSP